MKINLSTLGNISLNRRTDNVPKNSADIEADMIDDKGLRYDETYRTDGDEDTSAMFMPGDITDTLITRDTSGVPSIHGIYTQRRDEK